LYFFYFASDAVDALRSGLQLRAEFLLQQQTAFYDGDGPTPERALAAWRAPRREREDTYFAEARTAAGLGHAEADRPGGDGYEREAVALAEAIAHNERRVLILNVANRSSLPFLDEAAV